MPSNFQYEAYLLIHDILLGLTYCILRKFQPFKALNNILLQVDDLAVQAVNSCTFSIT